MRETQTTPGIPGGEKDWIELDCFGIGDMIAGGLPLRAHDIFLRRVSLGRRIWIGSADLRLDRTWSVAGRRTAQSAETNVSIIIWRPTCLIMEIPSDGRLD